MLFARPDGRTRLSECSGRISAGPAESQRGDAARCGRGSVILAKRCRRGTNHPAHSGDVTRATVRRGCLSGKRNASSSGKYLRFRSAHRGAGDRGLQFASRLFARAGSSVVDVGCGAGAYGPSLIARRTRLARVGSECPLLRHSRAAPVCHFAGWILNRPACLAPTRNKIAPFASRWLEHTNDPGDVSSPRSRASFGGRALFSVPNMELLPYLHDWRVVPWHLLEGDHKNFFTRASLRGLLARFFSQRGNFPLRRTSHSEPAMTSRSTCICSLSRINDYPEPRRRRGPLSRNWDHPRKRNVLSNGARLM